MLKNRKYPHAVFDGDESKEDKSLEKQFTAIKRIRQNRLNRYEAEYKKKINELELSRQDLGLKNDKLQYVHQELDQGKEQLLEKYLNTTTTLSHLQQWSDKESDLKKNVILVSEERDESLEKVNADERSVKEAKSNYQKTLLSIEKVDVLLEELTVIT